MSDQTSLGRIAGWMQAQLPAYLEELRQLCAIECPTSSRSGVNQAAAWVRSWAERHGLPTRTWSDTTVGDSLLVTLGGSGSTRVLLAAHLDTVYPVGTAGERPMQRVGGMLRGPGVADNKSGLLSGLYAALALRELGLLDSVAMIGILCGADEETDMRVSGAIMTELAPHYDAALVLEAARENGDIVGARKGGGVFTLETHGRAAHAGVEPEKGAHAILALAHHVIALQQLNGMRPGVTVNAGVVRGGSVVNAIPDYAAVEIDARVVAPEDVAAVTAAITAIAERPVVAGVTATLSGGFRMGPMAQTPAITALAQLASQCARELGFDVRAAATGGISYANHLAMLGLPVLDGLGPIGGLDHSPEEYIDSASIVPRTALLAALIMRCGDALPAQP